MRACGEAAFSGLSLKTHQSEAEAMGLCIMPDKRKFPLSRFASQGLKKNFSLPPLKMVSERFPLYHPPAYAVAPSFTVFIGVVTSLFFPPSPPTLNAGSLFICCLGFAA